VGGADLDASAVAVGPAGGRPLVAAAIGQVLDGALLIVILSTSGALEGVSSRRTRDAVTALLRLAPEVASRVGPDGKERLVEATGLVVGDRMAGRSGSPGPMCPIGHRPARRRPWLASR
jgi:cation transport ATPase